MSRPITLLGTPVRQAVTVLSGNPPLNRITATFDEVGDAFAHAVKHRLPGEVTTVEGHGKRWRYIEHAGKKAGHWKTL